jgi:hypothetical protein
MLAEEKCPMMPDPRPSRWHRGLQAVLFVNTCVFFIAWIILLATGTFGADLFTTQRYPVIPILHLVAEFGSGVLTLVGVLGWWRNRRHSHPLLLFGLGMGFYASLNSLGWALENSAAAAAHMSFGAIMAVTTLVVLRSNSTW